jgi:hypothetical protein
MARVITIQFWKVMPPSVNCLANQSPIRVRIDPHADTGLTSAAAFGAEVPKPSLSRFAHADVASFATAQPPRTPPSSPNGRGFSLGAGLRVPR